MSSLNRSRQRVKTICGFDCRRSGVNLDLGVRNKNGDIYTVRYDQVNAMLLNEFLKEHQKVQRLEAALAAMNEQLKAQDAKIDKVNAKVELSRPIPQVAENNQ
jgi:hypothetical protein